jgi:hypothetical protein
MNNREDNALLMPNTTTTIRTNIQTIQSIANCSINENNARLTLLPAYPSFDNQLNTVDLQDHLLLANVARMSIIESKRYLSLYYFIFRSFINR